MVVGRSVGRSDVYYNFPKLGFALRKSRSPSTILSCQLLIKKDAQSQNFPDSACAGGRDFFVLTRQ